MFRQILAIIAISLMLPTSVFAKNGPWYEVEVYLFEHQTQTNEQWPQTVTPINTSKAVDLITPMISTDITGISHNLTGCSANEWATDADRCNAMLHESQSTHPSQVPTTIAAEHTAHAQLNGKAVLLANSQSEFNDIIAKISRQPGVHSLLHMTWQQPMLPSRSAKPMRIYAGDDFSKQYDQHGYLLTDDQQAQDTTGMSLEIPSFSSLSQFAADTNNQPIWQLDGTIKIYLAHYLYVETNLDLRLPGEKTVLVSDDAHNMDAATQQVKQTPFLYSIPFKQNRRLRSGEIHYFDHPEMGMILQIRKMDQPQ
ncbi:peptidoglycan binding protein CsiV [Shewanella marina]|uniref:peptidoglycan binding protein CsiV n=1 Tax=Shewanella marina TaxID=487319 RepID=UPI00047142E8|nr:peptidoglycan binding protein CsiV [Shewanella marina]